MGAALVLALFVAFGLTTLLVVTDLTASSALRTMQIAPAEIKVVRFLLPVTQVMVVAALALS